MMVKIYSGLLALSLFISPHLQASDSLGDRFPILAGQSATLVDVLKQVEGQTPIIEINVIDGSPLFQVVTDNHDIFYLEETGRYLITGGDVVDIQENRMLTRDKSAELKRIPWGELPWEDSFSNNVKNDKYKIAVFTDVDCPYCANFERMLALAPDVEVHYFMNPLSSIHPQAISTTEKILCSDSPVNALKGYMLHGHAPEAEVTQSCKDYVQRNIQFAEGKGINSTPTIILETGERLEGAPADYATLKAKIDKAMGRN